VLDVPVDNRAQRQAPPDVRLAGLADRQHGIVTARQLRALDLEDATLALLRRHGFPRPQANSGLPGLPAWVEVDFHFPGRHVVVEVDGDRFRGTRWRRRPDARKQALLEAAGYRVLRLTWEQVTADQAQSARRIRLALGEAHRS
jgi:uncharacterized protein DUF559